MIIMQNQSHQDAILRGKDKPLSALEDRCPLLTPLAPIMHAKHAEPDSNWIISHPGETESFHQTCRPVLNEWMDSLATWERKLRGRRVCVYWGRGGGAHQMFYTGVQTLRISCLSISFKTVLNTLFIIMYLAVNTFSYILLGYLQTLSSLPNYI